MPSTFPIQSPNPSFSTSNLKFNHPVEPVRVEPIANPVPPPNIATLFHSQIPREHPADHFKRTYSISFVQPNGSPAKTQSKVSQEEVLQTTIFGPQNENQFLSSKYPRATSPQSVYLPPTTQSTIPQITTRVSTQSPRNMLSSQVPSSPVMQRSRYPIQ